MGRQLLKAPSLKGPEDTRVAGPRFFGGGRVTERGWQPKIGECNKSQLAWGPHHLLLAVKSLPLSRTFPAGSDYIPGRILILTKHGAKNATIYFICMTIL